VDGPGPHGVGGGAGHGDGTGGGGGGQGVAGDPRESSTTGTTDPDAVADDASESKARDATVREESASNQRTSPEPEEAIADGDRPGQRTFAGLSFPSDDTPTRQRETLPSPILDGPQVDPLVAVEPVVEQLRGTWQQVESGPVNAADFAPGGASHRIIGIDPQRRLMLAVTAWGDPPSLVLAGELEAGFRASGRVSIRVRDDLDGGRFPALPEHLPGELGAYRQPTEQAWELAWSIVEGKLTIGDRTYVPCDPVAMERLLADAGADEPAAAGPALPPSGGSSIVESADVASVDFFGLKATGRWFCYIVDVSGSMGSDGKLDRLKGELERSLRALPRDAHFFVIFFSGGHNTLQRKWQSASSAGSFIRKMQDVGAGGGTDPRSAFNIALTQLDPRPDAIFFMTDGQIPDETSSVVGQLNAQSPRVRIHAVAFGSDARGGSMSAIAGANGGNFKHVP